MSAPAAYGGFYVVFDEKANPDGDPGFLLHPGHAIRPEELGGGPERVRRVVESLISARPTLARLTRNQLLEASLALLNEVQSARFIVGVEPLSLDKVVAEARQRAPRKRSKA